MANLRTKLSLQIRLSKSITNQMEMDQNKKDEAKKVYDFYTSKSKHHLTSSLADIAPDIETYLMDFVFGTIYARKGLSPKEKTLVTITSLATQGGCEKELSTNINNALNVGVSPHEVVDAFIQLIPYCGFPKAINAIEVAKQVFTDREIDLS